MKKCECGRPACRSEDRAVRLSYAKLMLNVIHTERDFCLRLARIAQLDATT